MQIPDRLRQAALARIAAGEDQIQRTLECVREGRPHDAEPDQARKVERVQVVTQTDAETAKKIADGENPKNLPGLTNAQVSKAESIQGTTVDYLGVAWLDEGAKARSAVGRVIFMDGRPFGSGFLISDRLFITNNHVIGDKDAARRMLVEMNYELEVGQSQPASVQFTLDPDAFFITDDVESLDFTVIAVGACRSGSSKITDFGCCPLSDSAAKHALGDWVNIVQHPNGDLKQVVVRENRLVNRGDFVLHYLSDTEGGSSGSPVFNDDWQVVALHHYGGPHREVVDGSGMPLGQAMNEGIRISKIVEFLKNARNSLTTIQQEMLDDALRDIAAGNIGTRVIGVPPNTESLTRATPISAPTPRPASMPTNPSTPPPTPTDSRAIDPDYSDRRGYDPDFLPGHHVPLPQLSVELLKKAPRVDDAPAASPYELRYHHFSVVMNGERRMPFFSACNIDGARHMSLRRKGGAVSAPESMEEAVRSGEVWATDPRIPVEAQLSDAFYARLRPATKATINTGSKTVDEFFARGHMTRREDPVWGTIDIALVCNADTFHHTNACPQPQFTFNAAGTVWAGIEQYVLLNADAENERVTVITGPIFESDDPIYNDAEFGKIRIPMSFFKIVVRVVDGGLESIAIRASVPREVRQSMFAGQSQEEAIRADNWRWPSDLSVSFKTTVAEIARLTGLDFGDLGRDAFGAESAGDKTGISEFSDVVKKKRPAGQGFGKFESIDDFLQAYEASLTTPTEAIAPPGPESLEAGPERLSRKHPRPAPKARTVVEIDAAVARVMADDLDGAKHQQFTVKATGWIDGDTSVKDEVEREEARVAVRFGDSRGLPDRIPGIVHGAALHIKGEWISKDKAYSVGGEKMAVLHFTHDPLGFICTTQKCFS